MSDEAPRKQRKTAPTSSKRKSKIEPKPREKPEPYTGFKRIQKYSNLNLPDGTHRRKLEKIKKDLIRKAKVVTTLHKLKDKERERLEQGKKRFQDLARIQEEEGAERRSRSLSVLASVEGEERRVKEREEEEWNGFDDNGQKGSGDERKAHKEELKDHVHPDRRELGIGTASDNRPRQTAGKKGSRPMRFAKELEEHERVKQERERHKQELLAREAEKQRRQREREMWSKAINAKTRTGQVKLGKQSNLLLEKVRRQMAIT
ncbi:hypothetical protein BDZ91DRAFT_708293 [Kalaharituber pfeilii]|nr:hypothetical protein BDZ91DRAFT_708293 [Kalaharituber pfeilii]